MDSSQSINDLKKIIISRLKEMKAKLASGEQPSSQSVPNPDVSIMSMSEARKFAVNKATQGK